MATARLVPSEIYNGSSNYLTISSQSNMFTNTDSTNYGTVQNTRTATSSYYVYLRGFNFDSVPSNAIVSSIQIKIKAYQSGGNTSTIYMYNGTSSQVSACGSTTALGTSAQVQTFTNTTIDWDTMKGYGSDLGIRINCRRNNRNTTSYIYIYGAEIDVTYTVPVYHNVTVTGETGKVIPLGTESVLEGTSYTVRAYYDSKPTVTDNNVDVTSQVTQTSQETMGLVPQSNTSSGFSVSNITNAYADKDSDNYADLTLSGGSTGTLYLGFGSVSLPTGSTIQSVSCQVTLQYNRNGSSSGYTASTQMYTGNTAKGSSTSVVTAGGTDVAKTTFNLSVGSWTASELSNPRLYITATNNASSTQRHLYVYGATLSVTYSVSGVIYIYTISSVTADHTIVVTASASGPKILRKQNGSWVEISYSKVYKKVNGSWVEQANVTQAFDPNAHYKWG